MKTINQIKKEQEDKLSSIFNDLGIFFAFSKSQFEESKKEGITYVNGSSGMFIPKHNVQEWNKRYNEYSEEKEKEYAQHIPLAKYIKYELYNHECFYTGDYCEALEPVQCYYPNCTLEDVKRVFYLELPNSGQ